MNKRLFRLVSVHVLLLFTLSAQGQLPPAFTAEQTGPVRSTELSRKYLTPVRVVWTSDNGDGSQVINKESILKPGNGQADQQGETNYLTLASDDTSTPGIILDFGREIQGGLEIVATLFNSNPAAKVRLRFGESVAETCSELSEEGFKDGKWTYGSYNDHSMRDFEVILPIGGVKEVGPVGYRFVRIDLLEPNKKLEIKEISAVFVYRDIPYLGSFKSNDERLNNIWMTGAYTAHLNMQEFLIEGTKRDRLVWAGDMYPTIKAINAVFGYNEVVPKSLDLIRDHAPLPQWMNSGFSICSMMWLWAHLDWYTHHGDLDYLEEQKSYIGGLLQALADKIDEDGKEVLDGARHTDWNSNNDPDAQHEWLQSSMLMTFQAGKEISQVLADKEMEKLCDQSIKRLKKHVPDMAGSKQGASMLAISGLVTAEKANEGILSRNGAHGLSVFSAPFILEARVKAGDFQGALDNVREYFGAMIDLGSTTFWENFNVEWLNNAARIDEMVPDGKVDVHGDLGEGCYVSYRKSLCHAWGGGVTAWLSENVLGVKAVEPGSKTIRISPQLGDLEWVEGTYPTPLGVVHIKHTKDQNGKITTSYQAPEGVNVILNNR